MSKKNTKKKDIKKEILELLDLNTEEEIEEKKESYYEIVDSQQTKITLEKKITEIEPNPEEGKQEKKEEHINENKEEEISNLKQIFDTILDEDIPNKSDNESDDEEEIDILNIKENNKIKDNNLINQKRKNINEKYKDD